MSGVTLQSVQGGIYPVIEWDSLPSGLPFSAVRVNIYRRDNTDIAMLNLIATVDHSTLSYVDGTVQQGGARYQYGILVEVYSQATGWFQPDGGLAAIALYDWVYMQPLPVGNLTARRVSANTVHLEWDVPDYSGDCHILAAGSSSTLTVNSTELGVVSAGGTQWEGADNDYTWFTVYVYGKTPVSPGGIYPKVLSAKVQASAPTAPNQPGVSVSPQVVAPNQNLAVVWQHSPGADGAAQTGAQIRYRLITTTTWTVITTSTADQQYLISTINSVGVYELQVRTKGLSADYSPWSTAATFSVSTPPTVAINSPSASSTLNSSTITVNWNYNGSGSAQAAATVTVRDTATQVVLWTCTQTGTTTSWQLPYKLLNGAAISISVQATNQVGQASATATAAGITVNYAPPPTPALDADLDETTGAITATITIPPPTSGQVEPVTVQLWKNEASAEDILVNEVTLPASRTLTLTDPIPRIIPGTSYYAQTVTADGGIACSARWSVSASATKWIWLNAGPLWQTTARMWANANLGKHPERERALLAFIGREYPVEYVGEHRTNTIQVSGDVDSTGSRTHLIGDPQAFEAIADQPAPICYRTGLGDKIFCSISEMQINYDDSIHAHISFTLTRIDHEGD
jgi:hypothetical protein